MWRVGGEEKFDQIVYMDKQIKNCKTEQVFSTFKSEFTIYCWRTPPWLERSVYLKNSSFGVRFHISFVSPSLFPYWKLVS